jgi:hypothetical protein
MTALTAMTAMTALASIPRRGDARASAATAMAAQRRRALGFRP